MKKLFTHFKSEYSKKYSHLIGFIVAIYLAYSFLFRDEVSTFLLITAGVLFSIDGIINLIDFIVAIKKEQEIKIPSSDPSTFGSKGNIKELYEYLESRALTIENVQDINDEQMFPLWVNIDDVYHLLKYYQEGYLKKFLDQQDASGYWSFGYDACDFKMREFPEASKTVFNLIRENHPAAWDAFVKREQKLNLECINETIPAIMKDLEIDKNRTLEFECWCKTCSQVVRADLNRVCLNCENKVDA